jgi:PAS domain-containing protein/HPt (histidine-containing phosphotransfer) domain-containing protein
MGKQEKNPNVTASSEEIASHSIRANHELINDLCLARASVERINDDFPELLAIVLGNGSILRGNQMLADLLAVERDDIIDCSLKDMFKQETWQIFEQAMKSHQHQNSFSFEMAADKLSDSRLYHWTFSRFKATSERHGPTWCVLASDITQLRMFERKLATIFSTIPLGVLIVGANNQIEWPHSSYCSVLLETGDLSGRSVREGLFGRSLPILSRIQKDKIEFLERVVGQDESWYEMVRSQLPVELPVPLAGELVRWISLSYSPVFIENKIEKILIVMSDITASKEERERDKKHRSKEAKIANLIVDLRAMEPFLLQSAIEDIDCYLETLKETVRTNGGVKNFCATLHGIKGVARTVGLSEFKEFVHDMEARLIESAWGADAKGDGHLVADLATIDSNWTEIRGYADLFLKRDALTEPEASSPSSLGIEKLLERQAKILSHIDQFMGAKAKAAGSDQSSGDLLSLRDLVRQITWVDADVLRRKLQHICSVTAKSLNKSVRLDCDFDDLLIDPDWLAPLGEIFLHLLTNAIDHGIEAPDARKAAGKDETGVLSLAIKKGPRGTLACTLKDDGAGIDPEKVISVAVAKGIIDSGHAMTKPAIMNLILAPAFSTAQKVTETSGRGVGLYAACVMVKKLNATVELHVAESEKGHGTSFSFTLQQ